LLLGILLGLASALFSSISYVFSRLFVIRRHQGVIRLLVLGHAIMGAASLAAFPFLWSAGTPPLGRYVLPLLGTTGAYLFGQAALFGMLRRIDASRVSPLLGLKILILAAIAVIALRSPLSGGQWLAVALSVGAAMLLGTSGQHLDRRAVAGLLIACLAYCLSDLSIKALVAALADMGPTQSVLYAVSVSYILAGVIAAALLPLAGKGALGDLRYAVPWAGAWLAAMVSLYACFAAIGVVYGNIVQSTRGLMSVVIGARLAYLGMVHLERKTTRGEFLRRLAAAVLMTGAIALFFLAQVRPAA